MSQAASDTPEPAKVSETETRSETGLALLAAAEACLKANGYSRLSTRRVAESAGVPLSQIHYHFGSKQGLVLALLEHQNRRLLERQKAMFASGLPLWKRWELACDYLDDDLASGYVHVLQEMIAAGWSDPKVAAAVRDFLRGWFHLLTAIAREAAEHFGPLRPFTPAEIASLVGQAFLGGEAMILIGFEDADMPVRSALRKFGAIIRAFEEAGDKEG